MLHFLTRSHRARSLFMHSDLPDACYGLSFLAAARQQVCVYVSFSRQCSRFRRVQIDSHGPCSAFTRSHMCVFAFFQRLVCVFVFMPWFRTMCIHAHAVVHMCGYALFHVHASFVCHLHLRGWVPVISANTCTLACTCTCSCMRFLTCVDLHLYMHRCMLMCLSCTAQVLIRDHHHDVYSMVMKCSS